MTLIDISFSVSPASPEWPGDTPFSCGWTWDMAQGASVNVSTLTTSPHIGTHADAPLHVRPDTAAAHALPLAAFHGPAAVIDVSHCTGPFAFDTVRTALTSIASTPVERLLLKTGHTIGTGTFPHAWPALTPDCARELVSLGLCLLGVDAPSVDDRESKSLEVHHTLFDNGAYVLENLDLHAVTPGLYELMAFPAKWELDAAPVRAVLRTLR